MRRTRLHAQIFPSFVLILVASLAAITWYTTTTLRNFHLTQRAHDLRDRAELLVGCFSDLASTRYSEATETRVRELGERTSMRITLLDAKGEVLADSLEDPRKMLSHAHRLEVQSALQGTMGQSVRYSETLNAKMMYVAVPVRGTNAVEGVIRTAVPLTSLDETLEILQSKIIASGVIIALLVSGASFLISRRIARPLEDIRRGAERFARGDLGFRLTEHSNSEEIGALAESMNSMATQLEDRINALISQRNESEAVLSSMLEGVIAVNTEEELIRINRAAAKLIGVHPVEVLGRNILEVVRNVELRTFVSTTLASSEPVQCDLLLHGVAEHYVQANGTVLRDPQGRSIGALIVLNEITRLRKLETIRRDFVANVSHELKTPITSIKGFVETLLEGALDQPEDARRFLEIIERQSERLISIIEDLLSLSRIEQEAEKGAIETAPARLADILHAAVQLCQAKAAARQISIQVECPPDLTGQVNAHLIEQACINLLDNAIKYSGHASRISIQAAAKDGELVLSVQDSGCGIDREHLSRLFERFYRVDRARSRELGGTGLGLAIVKHIVQAHRGRVQVESTPGQGSRFSIHLPDANA